MKKYALILLSIISISSYADTIRTPDGYSCSFDPDSNAYEVSVTGDRTDGNSHHYDSDYYSNDNDENKVGVSFTWKFGRPKQLNCNRLFQIAMKEKEATVKLLEKKLEVLNESQNINWDSSK